jgi:hypothetical protein
MNERQNQLPPHEAHIVRASGSQECAPAWPGDPWNFFRIHPVMRVYIEASRQEAGL